MQFRWLPPLLIALCAAPAAPQDAASPLTSAASDEETLALGAQSTRMTVPVSIAGSTPYPFIIDTGAERSVISRQLAGRLGLAAGPSVRLTTMTGSSRVPTVLVPSMAVGPVRDRKAFHAPALEAGHMGALGMLGIEQLRTHMVSIDFDKGEMRLKPSRSDGGGGGIAPMGTDEIIVYAKTRFGQLIVTEAQFESTRVTVVLDTGSQISMGNLALQRRLRNIPLKGPITMTSVTGEQLVANYHIANRVKIGGVGLRGVPVAFADVPPFAHFGLDKRPALMLGMDALRAFRRVEIDFPARRVRFLARHGVTAVPPTRS